MGAMAQTASYALAHTFMPNLVKLKGALTVVGVMERKEKFFFDQVWAQAHVDHKPQLFTQDYGDYKIGVVDLPKPKEMGEAWFCAFVAKKGDTAWSRFFLLEHDYVLAKKADRTVVTEREGVRHTKHFDGPAMTGVFETDAKAFIAAFMELMIPTRVTPKPERSW